MWYTVYGWNKNPFNIRPNPAVVGLEEAKMKLTAFVTSSASCQLCGETGLGKSSLLLWLTKHLESYYSTVYINCATWGQAANLEQELQARRSLKDRLLWRKLPPNLVLLLDEAQQLDTKMAEAIKGYFDDHRITAIVFASIDGKLNNLSESFKNRIGGRQLCLTRLSNEQVLTLIKTRLKNMTNPFVDEAVMAELGRRAEFAPRKLLELCEVVCQQAVPKAKLGEKITLADLEDALAGYGQRGQTRQTSETDSPFRPADQADTPTRPLLEVRREVSSLLGLTAMQRQIVHHLKEGPKTVEDLVTTLKSSEGSIAKQLSRLRLADADKGIIQPFVQIASESRPKKYALTDWAAQLIEETHSGKRN